jgi:uncharacterized protein YecT (DUF1311 family)
MPSDRSGEPLPNAAYNGFAGGPPPPPRRRRWGRLVAIGAAGALVLGAGFGFLIRPDLPAAKPDDGGAASRPGVPIEVSRPTPPPVVHSDGKLEVLSPEVAAQAQAQAQAEAHAQAQAQAALSPAPGDLPEVVGPPGGDPGGDPVRAPGVAPGLHAPPPQFAAGRSDRCDGAAGPAEQLICSDPALASADRALARAYRRALASGADPRALRAEQRDFMAIREDAASRSRRALAAVMSQRIDELNAMADEARRGDGGPYDRGYDDGAFAERGPGWR